MALDYELDPKMSDEEKAIVQTTLERIKGSGQYQSLITDNTAKIKFGGSAPSWDDQDHSGDTGLFNRDKDQAWVRTRIGGAARSPDEMQNTIVHELTHGLQAKGPADSDKFRQNPLMIPGVDSTTSRAFMNALDSAGIMYGQSEPAAWLSSQLTRGAKPDNVVAPVAAQFPEVAKTFAERNIQPNRPMPTHFKGEPEWSLGDKAMNAIFGIIPTIK